MANVSIITFHYANNYGAVLQAYGLVKAIENMGHTVTVLDYRPLAARRKYEGHWPRRPLRLLKTWRFRNGFNRFREAYLPLSRAYLTPQDLENNRVRADYVVCGSDQVWNVSSYRGFDATFFLDFVQDPTPLRISYAATFGNAKAEDIATNRRSICSLLSRFHHISVRDAKSQSIVKDLLERSAVHVLDPCFLTSFDAISPPALPSHPYVLAYCYTKSEISIYTIQYLQRELRLPVISILSDFDGAEVVNPDPLQWLGLMRHASFVCTDSFHGTCFSIINRKQFIVLPYEGGMSRIEDVLKTAGLSSRVAKSKVEIEVAAISPIDYDNVSTRIDEARSRSFSFLRCACE